MGTTSTTATYVAEFFRQPHNHKQVIAVVLGELSFEKHSPYEPVSPVTCGAGRLLKKTCESLGDTAHGRH